ncbi:MAG TPA: transcription antitermination factor NusB [Longimicrobiales bacterium]|nr:transcription antitermination factor NusB [Longimicrobiales bacterium]
MSALGASSPGRRAALAARLEAERGRRLDRALDAAAEGLEARERSFAHELSYGTTRLRGRLDHLLTPHVHRGLEPLDPPVLEALRLGAYQILYMDSVPPYAAVSQSVDLVRERAGAGPTGLVNAVLRKVGRGDDAPERFPDFAEEPLAFLQTWGSHPRWLLERWLERWSPEDVRTLVEADNALPRTCLVPLEVEPEAAAAALGRAGLSAEPLGEGTGCVRLGDGVSPASALEVIPRAIVQDPAANLVVQYAHVPEGTKVADLCAAPGGKVLAVADRPVYTLAADRSERRLHMVRDNARRTGRPLGLAVADARRPPLKRVDVVLLDAPCTGTGTLQRKPDARWRLRPTSLDELVELQREMLDAAADLLPVGGLLVYSTCSLEREENEEQVERFLERSPAFRLDPTDAVPARFRDEVGQLVVTPQATGFDGAFAARLRRIS